MYPPLNKCFLLLLQYIEQKALHGFVLFFYHWCAICGNGVNTFTAIVDLSQFNNSCLKSPTSTFVDLTFQSRALRSFSLNQLRNLSL